MRQLLSALEAAAEISWQKHLLLAISMEMSQTFKDDHEQLRQGLVMYDALYAWCKHLGSEAHTWNRKGRA